MPLSEYRYNQLGSMAETVLSIKLHVQYISTVESNHVVNENRHTLLLFSHKQNTRYTSKALKTNDFN